MINRKLWTEPFTKDDFPIWKCSKCTDGLLQIFDEIRVHEDADTIQARKDYSFDFDEEWSRFRFAAFLKCNNDKCQEISTLTGRGENYEHYYKSPYVDCINRKPYFQDYDLEVIISFYPEYCFPPPYIFDIPLNAPAHIKTTILGAFSIWFSDQPSAANKLRITLEEILTEKGYPKKSGKDNLFNRVEKFCEDHNLHSARQYFDSLRKIGNDGSHEANNNLTKEIILDGFDLMNCVLIELYAKPLKELHLQTICEKYNKTHKK